MKSISAFYILSGILTMSLLFLASKISAQSVAGLPCSFELQFNKKTLTAAGVYDSSGLKIEVLKFYVSKIELFDETKQVFEDENFYLLDLEDPESFYIQLNIPKHLSFTHIAFNIGIDSLTNVSGAYGGDLDPTKGMYWTWQSGYINFKLEGTSDLCPARHHRFQYHIGGYQPPFNALQEVKLPIIDSKNIIIDVAIDKIFDQINVSDNYQIMSPNQQAMEFSKHIPTLFSISQ